MANPNTVPTRSLVAGLHAAGVAHACVAPGSRNTPLSLALADSAIEDSSHHDERSASFFALGMAKHTESPVVIVTTSGTASTELHPAIAEADAAHVPIIALTADRPRRLLGRAAPQTIDQRELFGPMVRWYEDVEVDSATDGFHLGLEAVHRCLGVHPGPVHLNLRFEQPLLIDDGPTPQTADLHVRPVLRAERDALDSAAALLHSSRGVIVAGPETWRHGVESIAALGRAWGWPVLSDPISGLRTGLADTRGVIGSDLLAAAGWFDARPPETVIRFGAPPTSKALNTWLAAHPEVPQVVVAPHGEPDPGRTTDLFLRADPGNAAEALAEVSMPASNGWARRWHAAQTTAMETATSVIAGLPFPTEPAVVATLGTVLHPGTALWAGSSMPIRDVDSFFPVTRRQVALHGNRGANGIDGLVSAAIGTAISGTPTVAVTGDVGMLHDIGALATLQRTEASVVIVVVNNDGGGIFHFLPQSGHRYFERHFGTPHGLSFTEIARGFGVEASIVDSGRMLEEQVAASGPRLLEVRTDRTTNVEHHRDIEAAVGDALGL